MTGLDSLTFLELSNEGITYRWKHTHIPNAMLEYWLITVVPVLQIRSIVRYSLDILTVKHIQVDKSFQATFSILILFLFRGWESGGN